MKTISRVIFSAILLVLTGLLLAIGAAAPAPMFDYYQEFSQKALSVLSGLTGVVPFAVWEVLALLLILWAIYTLIECLRRGRVLRWLSGVLVTVCTLVLLFVALWGLNHFGPTVGERMGLETRPYSVDEVYEAALWYAEQANTLATQMPTNNQNVTQFSDFSTLAKSAGKGYAVLSRQYDCFTEAGATVKKLTAWPLYSYSGITGIFIPFTGESNVNPDTYAASLPFTMCHELAHRQGYAAEDDANFCAYLACMASDNVEFRYSGAYSAFVYCYNALHSADRELAAQVWETASEQVRADCAAANTHYAKYEGKVQEVAQEANDAYLKAFDQEDGVQSYGAVADYLIALYLAQKTA
mgnify:FL=1